MMKSKMLLTLYIFAAVSFEIALFQFSGGRSFEAALSLLYCVVFTPSGIFYKKKPGETAK